MLLSMTGFGEAHSQQDGLAVAVEVRAINSRFFKLTVRATEGYAALEPHIEEVARKRSAAARSRSISASSGCIPPGLSDQRRRAERLPRTASSDLVAIGARRPTFALESLLPLPGVVDDQTAAVFRPEDDWPVISEVLAAALQNLSEMRIREGQAMADDLAANCRAIGTGVEEIQRRAPLVLDAYRARLEERINKVLAEHHVTLDPADLIREVSLVRRARRHLRGDRAAEKPPRPVRRPSCDCRKARGESWNSSRKRCSAK